MDHVTAPLGPLSAALRRQAAKLLLSAELNPGHPETPAIVVIRLGEVVTQLQRAMGSIADDALSDYPAEACDEPSQPDVPELDDGYADGIVLTEAYLHGDSGRVAALLPHMNAVDVSLSLAKLLGELMTPHQEQTGVSGSRADAT